MKDFAFDFDSKACADCGGKCCTGESGYIFASIKELEEIADFLKIPFEDFLLRYVKKVGYRFSLIEQKMGTEYACIFFDTQNKNCSIYDVRPKQCRDFPFWKAYLDPQNLPQLFKECKGVKRRDDLE
ncbi:YkgJ family cysteine cluster protein [Helicobacter pametensis]|uniref:YkgJ family cysteine cluster protein n=1 Tax=Helicobacter pametensis TaxID=95149 RepID=UPI0004B76D6A|nr:YkgJ family cysteine cluster protein [Helicobacter pametensis]